MEPPLAVSSLGPLVPLASKTSVGKVVLTTSAMGNKLQLLEANVMSLESSVEEAQ